MQWLERVVSIPDLGPKTYSVQRTHLTTPSGFVNLGAAHSLRVRAVSFECACQQRSPRAIQGQTTEAKEEEEISAPCCFSQSPSDLQNATKEVVVVQWESHKSVRESSQTKGWWAETCES